MSLALDLNTAKAVFGFAKIFLDISSVVIRSIAQGVAEIIVWLLFCFYIGLSYGEEEVDGLILSLSK